MAPHRSANESRRKSFCKPAPSFAPFWPRGAHRWRPSSVCVLIHVVVLQLREICAYEGLRRRLAQVKRKAWACSPAGAPARCLYKAISCGLCPRHTGTVGSGDSSSAQTTDAEAATMEGVVLPNNQNTKSPSSQLISEVPQGPAPYKGGHPCRTVNVLSSVVVVVCSGQHTALVVSASRNVLKLRDQQV